MEKQARTWDDLKWEEKDAMTARARKILKRKKIIMQYCSMSVKSSVDNG